MSKRYEDLKNNETPLHPKHSIPAEMNRLAYIMDKSTEEELHDLFHHIVEDANTFRKTFEENKKIDFTESEETKINEWVRSPEGEQTMKELGNAFIDLVERTISKGVPGHDKRHILIKDLLAGLQFLNEEQEAGSLQAYHKFFLIPSVMHDFGRLVEMRFCGEIKDGVLGVNHPKLSYFFTKKMLEYFPHIPPKLVQHILYAILIHQEGNKQERFKIADAVQRADREQLVGPEGILRMFLSETGVDKRNIHTPLQELRKTNLPLPGTKEDNDLMHHIEFYMRNLYHNAGVKGEERAEALKTMSGTFLYLLADDHLKEQFFFPEIQKDKGSIVDETILKYKRLLKESTWQTIKEGPNPEIKQQMKKILEEEKNNLSALLLRLIMVPGSMVTTQVIENIYAQLKFLPSIAKKKLKDALTYAIVMREEGDSKDKNLIQNIHQSTSPESLEYKMATIALISIQQGEAALRIGNILSEKDENKEN